MLGHGGDKLWSQQDMQRPVDPRRVSTKGSLAFLGHVGTWPMSAVWWARLSQKVLGVQAWSPWKDLRDEHVIQRGYFADSSFHHTRLQAINQPGPWEECSMAIRR